MEAFVKQYGLVVVYAMTGILIVGVLYGVFQEKWKSVGAIEDGIKTDFTNDTQALKKPFLLVKNQKVKVGAKVKDVREYAQARDIDEMDLEKTQIKVKEIDGGILNVDLSLSTNKPAKSKLEYEVVGKNGQSTVQSIIILVD